MPDPIRFTALDYVIAVQDALNRSDDDFATGLPVEDRERLVDALEAHLTRTMSGDTVTPEGFTLARTIKRQYLAPWVRAFDHTEQRWRWIDTTHLHATIALHGCTIGIPREG